MSEDRSSRRPTRGFTLLELAVVLAIIGVVAALALPQLRNVNQNNVARNDAYRFVEMMRDASELARSTRSIVCVVGVNTGQFEFREPSTGGSAPHCDTVLSNNGALIQSYTFPTMTSLSVQHASPPTAIPAIVPATSELLWAETEFGQPGGLAGVFMENEFGFSGGNGERTPTFTVDAQFSGVVDLEVTHYTSGTLTVVGL